MTWAHELENGLGDDEQRMLTVAAPADIPAAIAQLRVLAAAQDAAGGASSSKPL